HARDLGRSVGKLRNADVLSESIYSPIASTMKDEPGFKELRTALLSHRAAQRDKARSALGGDQWSRLQLYLLLWPRTIEDVAEVGVPVADFARSALKTGWKKIAKHGQHIETLPIEERHDMRKALKTFRYTAEFFGGLYEPKQVDKFTKDLK